MDKRNGRKHESGVGGEMSEVLTEEKVLNGWEYQNERAMIVPYVPKIPTTQFPEEFLAGLYLQTKKDGLLRRTFPGTTNYSMNWFISYFYNRSLLISIAKPKQVTGYAWLYEVEGETVNRKAFVGVCFFKEFWGGKIIEESARLGLSWFFEKAGVSTMYGTIAAWNRVSIRFGRNLGFRSCGCVPRFFLNPDGLASDNHIVALKREDFLGRT
jgi:RimJ/RimL family protein N-acetyltransferase